MAGEIFGIVVETKCQFLKEIAFPETIEAGLRIAKLGNSSVTYEIGLFREGDPDAAAIGESPVTLHLRKETGVTVIAAIRDGVAIHAPDPEFRFAEGDVVVVVGPTDAREKAIRLFRTPAG